MKKVLTMCLLLAITISVRAQFFNNVNSELCFQLYIAGDQIGSYRVFIVIDEENFDSTDIKILKGWETLSQKEKSWMVQRWSLTGKRIEAERSPFITYPPVFPNRNPFVLKPVPSSPPPADWGPWGEAKKFWLYKDRPF
jgi:hypothetical protein